MIVHVVHEQWDDIGKLLRSLPTDAQKEVLSEGCAWAMHIAFEEKLEENAADDLVFRDLMRVGTVLSLRRMGILEMPTPTDCCWDEDASDPPTDPPPSASQTEA